MNPLNAYMLAEAGAIVEKNPDDAGTLERALWLARAGNHCGEWWSWRRHSMRGGDGDEHEGFLYGSIFDSEKFIEKMKPCRGRIILKIDSDGGNARDALTIARWLAERGNVLGVVTGNCASGANVILSGCSRRICRPGSKFMLHAVRASVMGTSKSLRKGADNLDVLVDDLISFMSQRTSQPAATVREWFTGQEINLDAQQALANGLVDGILPAIADEPTRPEQKHVLEQTAESQTQLARELTHALTHLEHVDKNEIREFLKSWLTVVPEETPGALAPGVSI